MAIALLRFADTPATNGGGSAGVYLLGNWPAPFGIVLVVDRLSALMLVLTSILALAALLFLARTLAPRGRAFPCTVPVSAHGPERRLPDRRSVQPVRLLRGVAGGLLRAGSAWFGIACGSKPGLHYIAINLATSSLFLIGVSLIYGITGTLNMADLAARDPQHVADGDRMLLEAGAAILGVAFLVKAGMWPLCFWLPSTYAVGGAAGRGAVRDHDQGRHLRRAAVVAAPVRRRRRVLPHGSAATWLLIGGM